MSNQKIQLGKLRKSITNVKLHAAKAAYDMALKVAQDIVDNMPVDTGRAQSSVRVSIGRAKYDNGLDFSRKVHADSFKAPKDGKFRVYITVGVEYASMLEYGLYSNPGQPHYSGKKIGIVLRPAGTGWMVIRTTPQGFSNRAPRGILNFYMDGL